MEHQDKSILASLIVPIFNEERFIEECVRSLRKQDIPPERMELLLVDGASTDGTMAILRRLEAEDPAHIRVLENPRRIQAAAMNIGAKNARGKYLVRIDAHASYPENYASTCIRLLEETGAANAGCGWHTTSKSPKGKLIAKMLTSPFGVGGASFRVGGESGWVDTVPFGTFRRDYYEALGGFDERLARSEDNEINYRIRKSGGKIYMTNEIQVTYYCRETVKALAKMAYANGKWNVIAARLCPGSMSLKYFVPLAFVLSLIVMPPLCLLHPLFRWVFAAELLAYLGLSLFFAGKKTRRPGELLYVAFLFPAFHIPYGLGSLAGVFRVLSGAYR